jgi:endonuclease G
VTVAKFDKTLLDQLTPKQRAIAIAALFVVGVAVGLFQSWRNRPAPAEPREPGQTLADRNVRFGAPTPEPKDHYPIERSQFVLSYSDTKKGPNWVSWNLTKADIGNAKRQSSFEPDPLLPKSFAHVRSSDYSGSGFDRGHMCPSKDRSASDEDNAATFVTTNIVPQAPKCNQGGWERFESHCRDLANAGNVLYIACGPHGEGGEGSNGRAATVGKAKVSVPASVWKVVLVLPSADAVPDRDTKALAVWMPNDQSVPEDWKPYKTTVADVEKRTGYTFFPLLPADVAEAIKGR